jgi:two-component system CheB/CheR fusion protein
LPRTEDMIEIILERIREARSFDFRNYKRATLMRRIERRMSDRGVKTHADYLALLDREPDEFDALISSMLIKVTAFFRDQEIWDELSNKIVPAILSNKRPSEEVRIWCAGCSTGEEAFSIAMVMAEALEGAFSTYDIKVFGTDADEAAIGVARRGVYAADRVEGVPPQILARYFNRTQAGFAVKQEIRRAVVFGVNNLVKDAPISRLDLLICRNVFIYLDATLQKRVLTRFHYALLPHGVLVLGRAELIPFAGRIFEPLDLGMRVYRKDARREPERLAGGGEQDGLARRAGQPRDEATGGFHRDVLDGLNLPIVVTDLEGAVTVWNAAAARLWSRGDNDVVGRKLSALGLPGMHTDSIVEKIALVRSGKRERELADAGPLSAGSFTIEISMIRDAAREPQGLLYVAHDVTAQRALEAEMRRVTDEIRASHLKIQGSNEELRASNEELETTNEELQSANEELQTTNEELQSTNEELETTNEELQSANAELDATNRELAHRTEEMHLLGLYQRTIIRSLSAGIIVIEPGGTITSWNLAAERQLGLPESEVVGQSLWTLRIPAMSRQLIQRIRRALSEKRALREEGVAYELATGGPGSATVAALPLVEGDRSFGAVILFEDTTRAVALANENHRLKERLRSASPKSTDGRRGRPAK